MALGKIITLALLVGVCYSQRSPYAGKRPIGYPAIEAPSTEGLGNRFGNNNETTTTQRLPIEALGDAELVNRLGQLPQDQQPFWFINWQALESHRSEPHTFAQKPNVFNSPLDFPAPPPQNVQQNQRRANVSS